MPAAINAMKDLFLRKLLRRIQKTHKNHKDPPIHRPLQNKICFFQPDQALATVICSWADLSASKNPTGKAMVIVVDPYKALPGETPSS